MQASRRELVACGCTTAEPPYDENHSYFMAVDSELRCKSYVEGFRQREDVRWKPLKLCSADANEVFTTLCKLTQSYTDVADLDSRFYVGLALVSCGSGINNCCLVN